MAVSNVKDMVVPFHGKLIEHMIIGSAEDKQSARRVFDLVSELYNQTRILGEMYNDMAMVASRASSNVPKCYGVVPSYAWETSKIHGHISSTSARINSIVGAIRSELKDLRWDAYERADFFDAIREIMECDA